MQESFSVAGELSEAASTWKPFVKHCPPQSRSHNSRSLLFRHPGLCPSGSCEGRWKCYSHRDSLKTEVLLRRDVWLPTSGNSLRLVGTSYIVAQMLRGILVPTETGLDGAAGYALVGEFMLTFLPVFTCCR